jgi:putative SOS response-associated peptidase YedK
MCGRFTLTVPDYETLAEALGVAPFAELAETYRPRYNLPPMDPHWVLRVRDGARQLVPARWGLVPSWAKSVVDAAKRINARAETLRDKPTFRAAFERRRCVVPADGFFEWVGPKGKRQPIWFRPPDGGLLYFAGLYESRRDPATDTWSKTFTIITTPPNDLVAPVHDRMPAVLAADAIDAWMTPGAAEPELEAAYALLRPAPPGALVAIPVSSRVNDVANDDPGCLEPPEAPSETAAGRSGEARLGHTLPLFPEDS